MTKEQFEASVIALIDTLHAVSYSVLGNPHDQADAVSAAVLKALQKRETLRQEQYLKTWLVRILLNECYSILRHRRRVLPSDTLPASGAPDGADPALYQALASLPETLRLPLVLHHIAGYKAREIAKALRLPEGTVKGRLVRGRAALLDLLSDEEA